MHHSSYPEKSTNYSKETQSLGGLKYAQKLQATKQHREQERTQQLLVQLVRWSVLEACIRVALHDETGSIK